MQEKESQISNNSQDYKQINNKKYMYYCAMEQQKHVFYSTSGHYIIAKNTIVLLYCTLYIIYYKIYFLTKYYTYTTYNLQFTYTPSPLHSDLFCKLQVQVMDWVFKSRFLMIFSKFHNIVHLQMKNTINNDPISENQSITNAPPTKICTVSYLEIRMF